MRLSAAALINAISVRGFELLVAGARKCMAAAPTPVAALGALVETYVRFARENTAYVRLLYRPELSGSPGRDPAGEALAAEGVRLVVEAVP
jgi:hypothetical protein